jgi:hypothetical protein
MLYTIKQISACLFQSSWPFVLTGAGVLSASVVPLFAVQGERPKTRLARPYRNAHRAAAPQSHVHRAEPCPPMPVRQQWQRIADVINHRIETTRRVVRQQDEALIQLDAAEFALSKIVEELSSIMLLAPRGPAKSLPRRALRPALAA